MIIPLLINLEMQEKLGNFDEVLKALVNFRVILKEKM